MTAYVPHEQLDFAADGPWQSVAFSQDGRVLALSDARGGITLWDNASGEPIGGRLAAHGEYPVYTLAFDPTGPRLISATGDRNNPTAARHDLVLWDLADPAAPTHQVLAQQPSGHLVGRLASRRPAGGCGQPGRHGGALGSGGQRADERHLARPA